MAIGRLIQNTQRQDETSTRKPPSIGPPKVEVVQIVEK